jgi:hypothetical protein
MLWHIFADLDRRLTIAERHALFAALDVIVPDSGCVGANRSGDEESYFTVEAPTPEAARLAAVALLERTIAAAGLHVAYTLTAQADAGARQEHS